MHEGQCDTDLNFSFEGKKFRVQIFQWVRDEKYFESYWIYTTSRRDVSLVRFSSYTCLIFSVAFKDFHCIGKDCLEQCHVVLWAESLCLWLRQGDLCVSWLVCDRGRSMKQQGTTLLVAPVLHSLIWSTVCCACPVGQVRLKQRKHNWCHLCNSAAALMRIYVQH
jgi:hypothetical protein